MIRYKKKSNTHHLREAVNVYTLLLYKRNIGTAVQKDFIKAENKEKGGNAQVKWYRLSQ